MMLLEKLYFSGKLTKIGQEFKVKFLNFVNIFLSDTLKQ
jgi:hypothetical protein